MTSTSTFRTSPTAQRAIAAASLLVASSAITIGALGSVAPAHADTTPAPPPPPPGAPAAPAFTPPRDALLGPWLAIAWSPDNGDHGWANNRATVFDANNAAIANCQHFGGDQCQVVVSARDCGALYAASPDQNGQSNGHKWGPAHTGTGPTPDAAEQAAIAPGGVPVDDTGSPLIIRCATGDAGQG